MGVEVSFVSDRNVLALLAFEMAQWVEGPATTLMTYAQSLRSTWRKERISSHELSFDLHICLVATHRHQPPPPNTHNRYIRCHFKQLKNVLEQDRSDSCTALQMF